MKCRFGTWERSLFFRLAFANEVPDCSTGNSQKHGSATKDQSELFDLVTDVAVRGVLAKLDGCYFCRFPNAFALECFGNNISTKTKNIFAFIGFALPKGSHQSLFLLFLLLLFFGCESFFVITKRWLVLLGEERFHSGTFGTGGSGHSGSCSRWRAGSICLRLSLAVVCVLSV